MTDERFLDTVNAAVYLLTGTQIHFMAAVEAVTMDYPDTKELRMAINARVVRCCACKVWSIRTRMSSTACLDCLPALRYVEWNGEQDAALFEAMGIRDIRKDGFVDPRKSKRKNTGLTPEIQMEPARRISKHQAPGMPPKDKQS